MNTVDLARHDVKVIEFQQKCKKLLIPVLIVRNLVFHTTIYEAHTIKTSLAHREMQINLVMDLQSAALSRGFHVMEESTYIPLLYFGNRKREFEFWRILQREAESFFIFFEDAYYSRSSRILEY